MSEVVFYHLQRQPLDVVLPKLVQRSLARGWRVVVQASSAERVRHLDERLWTFSEESFLPHAADDEGDLEQEPVVLTATDSNPNAAQVRFLVDGAPLPGKDISHERIVVLFDGNDDDALRQARAQWSLARSQGQAATYWQQDDAGRWEKKA
jgi:DNA polymerase III subunit chi